ncbi:hypothetical protein Thal_0386 [Thermocrinis albus DSM 14484]|uniref:Cell division protein FtsQ n=1 Tax=Thermocrinis albus (strain DSM 14484 / JCM 11386 / HI 11/12) TaxID=638303 RepID=D3SPD4_THEAH|nr:hypothetical protein Thal_0386 [Thermocrinis albus DSM 14484]
MNKGGSKNRHKILDNSLIGLWIIFMSVAGFFLPYFLDSIEFFKVRGVYLEGNRFLPQDVFFKTLMYFKNNWLFMTEDRFLRTLQSYSGNSVKSLHIKRTFQKDGVYLTIQVQEREPLFAAMVEDKVLYFDTDGQPFYYPTFPTPPIIVYTHSQTYLLEVSKKLVQLTSSLKKLSEDKWEIYLTDGATVLYGEGKKLVLPPCQEIEEPILSTIERVYNVSKGVKEIVVLRENLAVVKEKP